MSQTIKLATLGGGCFWCVEAVYLMIEGIENVVSGYSGGQIKNPSYKEICTGRTGHAEVVQLEYDSTKITFEEILEIFWSCHNPTTLNRQGNDIGTQYRSVIYYHNDEQKEIADKSIVETAPTIWDDPIVTELSPIEVFYPAEEYHQDYYRLNPQNGYCSVVVGPKVAKIRKKYAHRLKEVNS